MTEKRHWALTAGLGVALALAIRRVRELEQHVDGLHRRELELLGKIEEQPARPRAEQPEPPVARGRFGAGAGPADWEAAVPPRDS